MIRIGRKREGNHCNPAFEARYILFPCVDNYILLVRSGGLFFLELETW